MRILFDHFSSVPNKITGISVYSWKILEALATHGQREYVLSTNWDVDKLPDSILNLPIEKYFSSNFKNETLAAVYNSWRLPALVKKFGCSAVLHPQPTSIAFNTLRNVTVIHDLYRVTHPHLYTIAEKMQWKLATAPAFLRSSHLIAVSDATKRSLMQAYALAPNRVTRVHEASPLAAPETVPPMKLDRGIPYALMVANVSPNKNVGLLASALALLTERQKFPRVVLIGRGDAPEFDDAVKKGAQLLRFSDVSLEDLIAYYYHARVLINTSFVEGFCLPILEAHTLGVPVICSDLDVLHEVAGDGAVYVNPTNAAQLADVIQSFFEDETQYINYKRKAKENAARFSWREAALETEAIIESVVGA